MISRKLTISGAIAILTLAACSGPNVKILDRPVSETKTARALTSSTALEQETRRTLRQEDLLQLYKKDSHAAISEMARRFKTEPSPERRLALAEMSSDSADILTRQQPLDALGRYLDAAWLTRDGALAASRQGIETTERTMYAYVSARVARLIRDQPKASGRSRRVSGSFHPWELKLDEGTGKVDPRDYDLVVPASWLKTDGIKWKSITQEGVGAAMVGHRAATPERKEADPLIPAAGRGFPLNARIDFQGKTARLVIQDLMDRSTTSSGVPLAANFSAAVSFSYYADVRRMNRLEALLNPNEYQDTKGMFSLRPYDPDRIPLILVHGLLSSAEAWYPFINLLLADPAVREHYQIVLFNYPTGVPISQSAAELRSALTDYQRRNDPNRSNPKMRDMVILGHSMGGIISNAQIRSSGDRVYDAYFTKDLNQLDLSKEQENDIKTYGYFKANPDIDRAILLAAPLRGSAFASNRIGQFGASLIRLPFNVVDAVFGQIEVVDALTDVAQQASQRPRNSVTSLRPDNPLLGAFLSCPVRPGVQIHSIVAQKDPDTPIEEGTDGFVPYTSSHLDEAVSEVVVKGADHRGMVNRDETVQEVWRILRLHAGIK
ncbi:esterase/lipase family protein [Haloferula rosea]|uniref:Alpha/beta fold hydrolase n=1 Tax=Haloferula rosea TaxID=490093 RepID=A0A934RAV5_9BACT|nr:alpha/beta hydrolase [Haloferula rosea]MBK1828314.1 alpha/beta fold hydrolase [Haloferula rosea]